MRTEDDLRAALITLERHAPEPAAVLASVLARNAVQARNTRPPVIGQHRRTRAVLVAAAASVAAVATATALLPGVFRPGSQSGPAASVGQAASVLRQLAAAASAQPTPALGPVLYTKEALWGVGTGSQRGAQIEQDWVGAAASHFAGGRLASYTKLDPRHNPDWAWRNPSALPAGEAALRRHLLSYPGGRAAGPVSGPPISRDEIVFSRAMRLMSTEPLRPATRAAMMRLIADIVRRSPREFVVLGLVTDRAGHRDIAIAGESHQTWTRSSSKPHSWRLVRTASTEVIIYFFDPVTGALRADEYTACHGPVRTIAMVSARCPSGGYEQYLAIGAVRSLPPGASKARTSLFDRYIFPWVLVIR